MRTLAWIFLFSFGAYAALNDVDKAQFFAKNILKNPGFENGKQSWTASGGALSIANASSYSSFLLTGKVSALWNASASSQTLSSAAITIPQGLYGKNGVVACKIVVPSGTATHTLEAYDGSSVLGAVTVTSGTSPAYTFTNFIFPSSGTIRARLQSQADEPAIGIDDCFMGDASEVNLTNITQSTFIGSAYIAAAGSCSGWTRTSSTFGAFASDTDCLGATVEYNPGPGTIQTTDYDLPKFAVNNLPPGIYRVTMSGPANGTGGASAYAINDGTTTSGGSASYTLGASGYGAAFSVSAIFVYTTAGNRTFEVYGANSASTVSLALETAPKRLSFDIVRFPLSSEQAYRPGTVPLLWSGYHDSTCSWSRTSASYGDFTADATCALVESSNTNMGTITTAGAALPGIVFSPPTLGRYRICANISQVNGGTTSASAALQLLAGAVTLSAQEISIPGNGAYPITLCGTFQPTAINSSVTVVVQGKASAGALNIHTSSATERAIDWNIALQAQQIPAPLLVNSVVSPSSGVETINRARLNCDSSSAITTQSGSWISSIGNVSAGACAVTFSASAFSSAPMCVVSEIYEQGGDPDPDNVGFVSAPTTSGFTIDCEINNSETDCPAYDVDVICMGPK